MLPILGRIITGTLFLYASLALFNHSAQAAGTKSYQFLKIGTIARSSGMGGAFVAVADDEAALYYNPSGLAGIKQKTFIAGVRLPTSPTGTSSKPTKMATNWGISAPRIGPSA
jgi:hypothetical protein